MKRLSSFREPLSLGAKIGLAIITVNAVAAVFAPTLAPFGETELIGDPWQDPNLRMLLGTDHLGRDLLSRLLYGARTSIGLTLAITVSSFLLGIATGVSAALLGGWFDEILSRFVDAVMAIPTLIFALLVLAAIGTSIPALVGVIVLLDGTRVFRLARAVAMDIAVMDYIEVARLRGERMWWVMYREILPNALPPLVAEFGLRFCFAFLFVAALSFLGLGIQPPAADWGGMVRENAEAINYGIVAPLIPAAAIAVLTVGVNLLVDGLMGGKRRAFAENP